MRVPDGQQSGDSISIHQGSDTGLHRNTVAIPVSERLNLLQYVSCHRIRLVLNARRLREWAGILVFGTFSIQRAARQMDISAFVPPQDLGFDRRAVCVAVQG